MAGDAKPMDFNLGVTMTTIFDASAPIQLILDAVLLDGVAGIRGGRVVVRSKLHQVSELAKKLGHTSVMSHSTYDHPETELAYPYDEECFSHSEAKDAVLAAFVP